MKTVFENCLTIFNHLSISKQATGVQQLAILFIHFVFALNWGTNFISGIT